MREGTANATTTTSQYTNLPIVLSSQSIIPEISFTEKEKKRLFHKYSPQKSIYVQGIHNALDINKRTSKWLGVTWRKLEDNVIDLEVAVDES